ncbi:unnamed protein product, partial [Staurois parvus]
RVRNNQADKVPKEQAGEWSGIAEVRTGGVHSGSGSSRIRNQAGSRQDAGRGAHGKHTPRH